MEWHNLLPPQQIGRGAASYVSVCTRFAGVGIVALIVGCGEVSAPPGPSAAEDQSAGAPRITGTTQFDAHRNQFVVLTGAYHDPGKGSDYVLFDGQRLDIADHSFFHQEPDGRLTP